MWARPDLPSTSTTSVDRPARAAARASVAVTTVLPTPPFPATMTNRDAAKNRAGSKYDLPDRGKPGLNGTPQAESEATQGHRRARAHGPGPAAARRWARPRAAAPGGPHRRPERPPRPVHRGDPGQRAAP